MGVSCKGWLRENPTAETILQYITKEVDSKAKLFESELKDDILKIYNLAFHLNGHIRSLFIILNSRIDEFENNETQRFTFVSLGHDEDSSKFIANLIENNGGGYFLENDCSGDVSYIDGNGYILPKIPIVTIEEVYEKFGGPVIIKGYKKE